MLRPRVVGEWIGREEVDADPLAAEMLHPPVPRAKIEVCWSGDGSPARRLVIDIYMFYVLASVFVSMQACAHVNHFFKKKSFKLQKSSPSYFWLIGGRLRTVAPEECPSGRV